MSNCWLLLSLIETDCRRTLIFSIFKVSFLGDQMSFFLCTSCESLDYALITEHDKYKKIYCVCHQSSPFNERKDTCVCIMSPHYRLFDCFGGMRGYFTNKIFSILTNITIKMLHESIPRGYFFNVTVFRHTFWNHFLYLAPKKWYRHCAGLLSKTWDKILFWLISYM